MQELVEVKKLAPECDSTCKANCDAEADKMIRELKNPLYDITWNCKNNYDVYTTDYDLYGSHFDRVSMEVIEVERILHAIRKLEKKVKLPWTWSTDERDTDLQTLWELKKEFGIPKD